MQFFSLSLFLVSRLRYRRECVNQARRQRFAILCNKFRTAHSTVLSKRKRGRESRSETNRTVCLPYGLSWETKRESILLELFYIFNFHSFAFNGTQMIYVIQVARLTKSLLEDEKDEWVYINERYEMIEGCQTFRNIFLLYKYVGFKRTIKFFTWLFDILLLEAARFRRIFFSN